MKCLNVKPMLINVNLNIGNGCSLKIVMRICEMTKMSTDNQLLTKACNSRTMLLRSRSLILVMLIITVLFVNPTLTFRHTKNKTI